MVQPSDMNGKFPTPDSLNMMPNKNKRTDALTYICKKKKKILN